MNNKLYRLSVGLILTVIGLSTAHATLELRPNGMVYDSIQDITWIADANYARTSNYDADGLMTWTESVAWADQLVYGGYNDWRLFDADGACGGYDCNSVGNELGHLFYNDLNVLAGNPISSSIEPEFNFFTNVIDYAYWSATTYAPTPTSAWFFYTSDGKQTALRKDFELYAWAVRDGDSPSTIPEPASLLLLLSGLLGIRGVRVLQQRR